MLSLVVALGFHFFYNSFGWDFIRGLSIGRIFYCFGISIRDSPWATFSLTVGLGRSSSGSLPVA
jgi:hypothetical protein